MEEKKDEKKFKFKISLIGNSESGKTSLLERYLNNIFLDSSLTTIGTDFFRKELKIKNIENNEEKEIPIILEFFDTAGQERFRSICTKFIKNAHCIIFTINLYSKGDIKLLNKWMEFLEDNISLKCILIYCGTKIDLEETEKRYFFQEDLEKLNKKRKGYYFETSSKINKGVDEMFDFISKEVFNVFYEKTKEQNIQKTVTLKRTSNKKKCCS